MATRCVDPKTGQVKIVTGNTCPVGWEPQPYTPGSGAASQSGGGASTGPTTTYNGKPITRPNLPRESPLYDQGDDRPDFNDNGSPINQPYEPWSGLVPPTDAAWVPRQPSAADPFIQAAFNTQNPATLARYQDPNSGINSTWATQSAADSAWYALSPSEQSLFTYIAQQEAGEKGRPRSGRTMYEEFVNQSAATVAQGNPQNPYSLAYGYAVQQGWISNRGIAPLPGSATGGGGGSAGPSPADPSAVKRMMDSMASDLIGRTLSNEEFRRYYRSYVRDFAGNPEVDAQQHGTEALQANEGYQEYQVAGKFARAFEGILRGAS